MSQAPFENVNITETDRDLGPGILLPPGSILAMLIRY